MTKTYTTVADKVSGDAFTEAMWDSQIAENINNLVTPCCCIVEDAGGQTYTTSVAASHTWDTEVVDNDTMHDNVTNSHRITFNTTGLYLIYGRFQWAANINGLRHLRIKQQDGTTISEVTLEGVTAAGVGTVECASAFYNVTTTGWWVQAEGLQTSGGNLSVLGGNDSKFGAVWVGKSA